MQAKLEKRLIDNKDFPSYDALKGNIFYVKDYQRSYKWEKRQVEALLKDLKDFITRNGVDIAQTKEKYCLQPLVVKEYNQTFHYSHKLGDDAQQQQTQIHSPDKPVWEVIDGQQRLTTLWLILDICQGKVNLPEPMPFNIYYEQFRAMDKYYIDKARETINNWLVDEKYDYWGIFYLISCIRQFVLLIWYEVDKKVNSVDVFNRLNIGKIPLTDAELFKAMLLTPDKSKDKNLDIIAYEWDSIEQQLRDEDFWFFLSNKEMAGETRIDFLLRLYAVSLLDKKSNVDENGELFAFMTISEHLEKNNLSAITIWEEGIVKIFDTLKWWYRDHALYHKIGFIIIVTPENDKYNKIKDYVIESQTKTKEQFKSYVQSEVKNIFDKILQNGKLLTDLDYKSDNGKIKKILLYFNLITMIKGASKARFSFRNYKFKVVDGELVEMKWQLEHIHAQKTDEQIKEMGKDDRKKLLEGLKKELTEIADKDSTKAVAGIDTLLTSKSYESMDKEKFYKFYKDIALKYGEVDMHGIGNLALLDSNTNESYHNDLFPSKRKEILARSSNGTFIPVCTRNVFLKAYSPSLGNDMKWTKADADAYADVILQTFNGEGIWQ